MALVSIPILDYELRFRKLTFREEFALHFTPEADPCRTVLIAALAEVYHVGHPVFVVSDLHVATAVLRPIPPPVLQRIWIAYKAGVEGNRFFTTKRLYRAPDVRAYNHQVRIDDAAEEATLEPGLRELRKQFGPQEAQEAAKLQQAIFADAKHRNVLTRAREHSDE